MKNLLFLTASIVAINAAVPAFGANLAPQPVQSNAPQLSVAPAICYWTGYCGGWGSSHNCWDFAGVSPEGAMV